MVYFPTEEVKGVLGDHARYARLPDGSELRRELYRWLGVRSQPRITDMLRVIDQTTTTKPNSAAKSLMIRMLGALGQHWGNLSSSNLSSSDESSCLSLRTKAWLPAEADANTWYRPEEVFAAYNKDLFASRAGSWISQLGPTEHRRLPEMARSRLEPATDPGGPAPTQICRPGRGTAEQHLPLAER